MKHAHRTDFLFIGVAVLPAVLMVAGYLDVAYIFFCPLLIAACLHGMYEQKMEPIEQQPLRDAETPSALPSAAVPRVTPTVILERGKTAEA